MSDVCEHLKALKSSVEALEQHFCRPPQPPPPPEPTFLPGDIVRRTQSGYYGVGSIGVVGTSSTQDSDGYFYSWVRWFAPDVPSSALYTNSRADWMELVGRLT